MKKIELGCLGISFILVILLISSLRSNWEKVEVKFDKTDTYRLERNIYSTEITQTFLIYDVNEKHPNGTKIPIETRYYTNNTTHTLNAFGALSIIFLFFNIVNLLKINIKAIGSNLYATLEKISIVFTGIIVLFCIIGTFLAFGLNVQLYIEETTQFSKQELIFVASFVYNGHLPDIKILDPTLNQLILTGGSLQSSATSGFYLMVFCLILSIVYGVLSGLRYREVRSPSSSIDYRFLYSGEDSSFLNDDDPDEFDESGL
ncbi:hypothetical protein DICPUDRAFT_99352 [Dictyostelium purpureum]|uniref:Uncharacterized protein n=1 Tax=Dictyostelium purpureum TaxID=5786 RepID=F0ZYF6_DICPU|nr:uncharacterized protein DICPUDRAFT_99352 [Dictyostelium purpureum]EGC31011.1 hypothetical protein DICPUDRAFT_99352 [Dictyostelium purpureum]|eukprot:XP_003292449.1 hypothetical protein DICPUDRAFT_99352 [Dictyostelium purpureum]